jgi:hypothetical protein
MKNTVLEMKNKDNQSTIFKYFKVGNTGEENNVPLASLVPTYSNADSPKGKKFEDLDASLLSNAIDLPNMLTVPTVSDALSVQDNMKLWTILGFLEDHAKGYIGSDLLLPELGNLKCAKIKVVLDFLS